MKPRAPVFKAGPIELEEGDEGRAVTLFLAMETQWLRGGLGERVGLNYAMIEPTAAMLEIRLDPRARLMLDLQIMERAALGCWAEQRARDAKARG